MISGYLILYLLFLKKQFGSASDGVNVVLARALIHMAATYFLSKFSEANSAAIGILALTYLSTVVTVRLSTFILTGGIAIRSRSDPKSNFSYSLSRIFSVLECLPAILIFLILFGDDLQSLMSMIAVVILLLNWQYLLSKRVMRLGAKRKVFKQYISLLIQLVLPLQLFSLSFFESNSIYSMIPVGYFCGVTAIWVLLLGFSRQSSSSSFPDERAIANTGGAISGRRIGVVNLLIPKNIDALRKVQFKESLEDYLDKRIEGFGFLKERYIKYLLMKLPQG